LTPPHLSPPVCPGGRPTPTAEHRVFYRTAGELFPAPHGVKPAHPGRWMNESAEGMGGMRIVLYMEIWGIFEE